MAKYKAGDRVKILAGHPYWLGENDETGLEGEGVYIGRASADLRGKHKVRAARKEGGTIDLSFKGRELELLPAAPAAQEQWVPKVGDRVRFVEKYSDAVIGDEGEVTGFWGEGEGVKVRTNVREYCCYFHRVEPLPVAEQPAPSPSPEAATAETAFVPFKTGDRIRCDDKRGAYGHFVEGELYTVKSVDGSKRDSLVWVEETDAAMCAYRFSPAPLTIQCGRHYRTRDGRKVGPMVDYEHRDGFPWCDAELVGGYYSDAGLVQSDDRSPHEDLVAELVDPAYTLGKGKLFIGDEPVAEITPIELPAAPPAEPKFKVGDKVRALKTTFSGDYKAGEIYEVREALVGHVKTVRDSFGSTSNGWGDHNFEPATHEPATTEAKFKVGDRVWDERFDGSKCNEATISAVNDDGRFTVNWDDGQIGEAWWKLEEWGAHEPAPTPVGAAPTPIDPTPPTNFIVARLTPSGQPRPNARPRVHLNLADAEQEAQRLADRLGDEFAVYQRVAVREVDAGPVPKGFHLERAKRWVAEGHSRYSEDIGHSADSHKWGASNQGFSFWSQQWTALTPLGRAILRKWIAEVEAGQCAKDKATTGEVA